MPERKQNRVRIDAISNAIRKGEYDDKLKDLRAAIDARLDHKRQEVLTLVQEVYGEDYVVTTKGPVFGNSGASMRVLDIESASTRRPDEEPPEADALGADPVIPGGNGGAEDQYESRSPLIG